MKELKFEGKYYTPEIFRVMWQFLYSKYSDERYTFNGDEFSRIVGVPKFYEEPNTINVITIRNNPEIAFNDSDTFDNDEMIVYENTSSGGVRLYRFNVTADPKSRKDNIAHLLKGCYASYRVGNHRWVPGRTALRQDENKVLVARTDNKGNIKKVEYGMFGINIHDSGGFRNSSLGCTILANDVDYKTKFKPMLLRIQKQKPISYILTDHIDVSKFLNMIKLDSIEPKPIEVYAKYFKKVKGYLLDDKK